MIDLFAVATGGAVGALLRWGTIRACARSRWRGRGPWDAGARATFLVNLTGCALFGLWAGLGLRVSAGLEPASAAGVDLWVWTGLCGGMTTFSTAIADGARLREERGPGAAFRYAAATLLLGLLILWAASHVGS